MIRAAFFGTPAEAVPVLAGLLEIAEVTLVVTQPDRPRGRSGRPQPPPVKIAAEAHGLVVMQPRRLGDLVATLEGVDVAVVAAFGRLIPPTMLVGPRRGFVNVHFSLLPRWRGASPVVRAILAGDAETGVTLMEMDEGLDTGAIIASGSRPIGPAETAGDLTARLADLGGRLIVDELGAWLDGDRDAVPQDEGAATAAGKVSVDEAFVSPARHGAEAVVRAVRAFNPRPGAWAVVEGVRLKLWRAGPAAGPATEPGVARVVEGLVLLGCADGVVELLRVQPAGKPEMDAVSWMSGRRGEPARFEMPLSR
ncbi:MAG TPA: methionyl-tRNA formyltransferase [Acidimicrobiia bacterium]|nr:methionyl-tRNA formyltransferase [Acidimicrobiia bacterium]